MTLKAITTILVDDEQSLTFDELCKAIHTKPHFIIELVEHELIFPSGLSKEEWLFDSICIHRIKTALSFYHDLEINLHGIALALDLLEKIGQLESRIKQLEKYEEP